jgi:hypothetical protein
MHDQTRTTMHLAVLFTAGGFLLIVLGWNGAANLDYVQGQIPYLISGGVAGLGLIGLGLMLAIVQELRRTNAELTARVEGLADLVAGGRPDAAGAPTGVPLDGTAVIAGAAVYHLPSCRLVEQRPGLQAMAPFDAVKRGLAPCRVCRPADEAVG